ncbi:MAG: hypothetical protein NTU88_16410 [Armatimonadetes bacterium]|nr:hypothetical protein [Armatimonadota bacterium]
MEEVDYGELREHGRLAIEIEVDDVARAERILRDELGFVGLSRSGEASLRVTDRMAKPASIARALVGAGIALERLVPMVEDLERHFMRLTGGES